MQPRPLLQHAQPAYPTRREFLAAAAALAAAGISGCGGNAEASAVVAPIFEHGEGRGAGGCIVVSPPVFLSEEEALQVVREELAKAGITLGEGTPLPEVTVEYEDPNGAWMRSGESWLGDQPMTVSKPAELAAVDLQHRVGVEVVTRGDCDRFSAGSFASASSFDTKGLAESMASGIRAQARRDLTVGVFYDPLEKWSFSDAGDTPEGEPKDFQASFQRIERAAKGRSQTQLRLQVQDFVAWLEQNR